MKKIFFISVFVFVVALSLSINAASKPKDVYGWDNLRWGMTVEEVQSILGKKVKNRNIRYDEKDNMYSGLQLKDLQMAGKEFRASLWMDSGTKRLSRIVFVPQGQPEKYEWAESFISLEKYLVKKYGDPDIQKTSNDPGTSADRIWQYPSTEIELSYLSIEGAELLLLVFSSTNNSLADR